MSDVKTIELYGTQDDFVRCEKRFTAFIGGIGSGKTWGGACKALVWCAKRTLGLVVSPTYPMLRDATLRTFMDVCGPWVKSFSKTEMIATMTTGAEVLFRSADNPDRLRGPNLHWAWIDEAALCPRQTWEVLIGRLRAGGMAGPCWITTTPKGRNWLFERQDQLTIFRGSTMDNPYLSPEFVQSLQAAYTGKFAQQELEGLFVAFEGLIYDEFSHEHHIRVVRPEDIAFYTVGVDEGYTNPAVALVIGHDNDGRAHIVEEFYQRRITQETLVKVLVRLDERFDVYAFHVDSAAAGLIASMGAAGLPAFPADKAVNDGIQLIKAMLAIQDDGRPRLTTDPKNVNTIGEFESYVWAQDRHGDTTEKPVKDNDHAMDAVRYDAMATQQVMSPGLTAIL